jgi:[ribosomal protein S5]-alanine N-acetyltransferase
MELGSERLKLIPVKPEDLDDVHALHSFKEVDEFNTTGLPADGEVTRRILNDWIIKQSSTPRQSITFSIRLKEENVFTGLIGMKMGKPGYRSAEVWYKLRPDSWRKGYATEALKEVLEFGFRRLDLHRIEAGCAVQNFASIRVLEKAGMVREGSCRKILPVRGQWVDNFIYSILEEEYLRPPT